ncbi:MAG: sulfatase-like hydrolase/transferase, partial [Planctomycetes bacterium]|nr:sulfatase-like hydrolase/transferase [Planctomycetota bacterium]
FRRRFDPRGVLHCWATDKDDPTEQPRWGRVGKQRIEDTGPLTMKRMETIDDETTAACKDFITRQHQANKPFFVWMNTTHMHAITHTKPKSVGQAGRWQSRYHDTMVDHDKTVGELLDLLDELGIADNTVVCLTSDNGARGSDVDGEVWNHKSCGDLRGYKGEIWEGGHRVPLIVRWPERVKAGCVCDDTVGIFDTIATFAEITDNKPEGYQLEDAISYLPSLEGKPGMRNRMVHHSGNGVFGLRDGEMKYITLLGNGAGHSATFGNGSFCEGGPEGQVYNMDKDKGETTNLWLESKEQVENYEKLLGEFRQLTPREIQQKLIVGKS